MGVAVGVDAGVCVGDGSCVGGTLVAVVGNGLAETADFVDVVVAFESAATLVVI